MGALIKNFNNKRISSNPSPFIGRFPIHRQIGNPILKSPFFNLNRKRFRPNQPPAPQPFQPPQPQSPAPQPFQPPQIEDMPQIIPTDLMNRFPFIPFQPQPFNGFGSLDFTSQDFTYTPSNLDFSQPTIPRFNYPIIGNRFGIPRTDEFGMPRIIPTELIDRISKFSFPRLRFPMPRLELL